MTLIMCTLFPLKFTFDKMVTFKLTYTDNSNYLSEVHCTKTFIGEKFRLYIALVHVCPSNIETLQKINSTLNRLRLRKIRC